MDDTARFRVYIEQNETQYSLERFVQVKSRAGVQTSYVVKKGFE